MILDRKIQMNDGSMRATFWFGGWLKNEEVIAKIRKEIYPFIILSCFRKYIYGITGQETEIHIFAVKMKIFEVNGEKDEDEEEAYLHNAS
jgi:hypothetical protein